MENKKELLPCKGKTRGIHWPYQTSPCRNKSSKDGYCKIHHPDIVKAKNKSRIDAKEKLYQKSREGQTQFKCECGGQREGLDESKLLEIFKLYSYEEIIN